VFFRSFRGRSAFSDSGIDHLRIGENPIPPRRGSEGETNLFAHNTPNPGYIALPIGNSLLSENILVIIAPIIAIEQDFSLAFRIFSCFSKAHSSPAG
jgi:hypothetical protein